MVVVSVLLFVNAILNPVCGLADPVVSRFLSIHSDVLALAAGQKAMAFWLGFGFFWLWLKLALAWPGIH